LTKATVLTDRFDRALLYATHVHGGQVRKGTSTPYVAHLLAVAATVLEYGGDEDLAIAALLHDSVEDQGGAARLNDIRNRSERKLTSRTCGRQTRMFYGYRSPTKFTMRAPSFVI
jgi:(p)ppGpp synthase/HD superfamily hydrolase